MIVTKQFTTFTETYRINLRPHDLGEITISRHKTLDDTPKWKSTKINWCSCGEKSPNETLLFTEALAVAQHLADCIETGKTPTVAISK